MLLLLELSCDEIKSLNSFSSNLFFDWYCEYLSKNLLKVLLSISEGILPSLNFFKYSSYFKSLNLFFLCLKDESISSNDSDLDSSLITFFSKFITLVLLSETATSSLTVTTSTSLVITSTSVESELSINSSLCIFVYLNDNFSKKSHVSLLSQMFCIKFVIKCPFFKI